MQIIRSSSNLTDSQNSVIQQGASFLMVEDKLQIGVWTAGTPDYLEVPAIAIGACLLENDNAVAFLKKCISFLKNEYPNRAIIGPMNGNTWMKRRLILASNNRPAFLMEPIEPENLLGVFEAARFEIISRYSSSEINLLEDQPDFNRVEKLIDKQGITVRSIDMQNFEQDLKSIYKLSIAAFSNNFLYTPLPEGAFMHSYISSQDSIDPELVLLAFKNDRLIGFLFCMPDIDPSTLIVKTLATCPEHRAAGLGTWLVAQAQLRAKEKGYTSAIHALQYESNASLRISQRFGAEKFRTYGLMHLK